MSDPTVYLQPGSAQNRQPADVQWQVAENYVGEMMSNPDITSGDKYYAWLRDNGQQVSRDVARSVWKQEGIADRWKSIIAKLPPGQGVPRAWYANSESPYIKAYGYKATITYTDAFTGDSLTTNWFTNSSRQLSRRELAADIKSQIEVGSGDTKGTVTGVTYGTIYHKSGAQW
jgi:hypothetical protein